MTRQITYCGLFLFPTPEGQRRARLNQRHRTTALIGFLRDLLEIEPVIDAHDARRRFNLAYPGAGVTSRRVSESLRRLQAVRVGRSRYCVAAKADTLAVRDPAAKAMLAALQHAEGGWCEAPALAARCGLARPSLAYRPLRVLVAHGLAAEDRIHGRRAWKATLAGRGLE